MPRPSPSTTGVACALGAFTLWGIAPLFFRLIADVPTLQIVCHRIVWSLALTGVAVLVLGHGGALLAEARRPRVLARFVLTATIVSGNWGLYIWAVNHDHVVDSSLGYFINPLVSVALGTLVLHERLGRAQWVAVALAAAGVAWLTALAGAPPWIGLGLALSFALYGLLRKTASLGALDGVALETLLLTPAALLWLGLQDAQGAGVFGADFGTSLLLVATGPVTAIPLMLFAAGARRLPLATVGLLQYVGPTLQLIIGVWLFGEPFPPARALGFAAIWASLAVLAIDGLGGWRALASVVGRRAAGREPDAPVDSVAPGDGR
jgi:chloramphenicol-sensitive protein RarD